MLLNIVTCDDSLAEMKTIENYPGAFSITNSVEFGGEAV